MKQLNFIFIIFNIFLYSGCNPKTAITKEFESYMKNVFDTVPLNGSAYLLVPDNLCKNCVMLDANNLPVRFNNCIQIYSQLKQNHFKNFRHYHYDKEGHLSELKLLDYEPKLLVYDHNQVLVVRNVKVSPYGSAEVVSCEKE